MSWRPGLFSELEDSQSYVEKHCHKKQKFKKKLRLYLVHYYVEEKIIDFINLAKKKKKAKLNTVSIYERTLKQEKAWDVSNSSSVKPSMNWFLKSWVPHLELHKPGMRWYIFIILALKRWRQEYQIFKVFLRYIQLKPVRATWDPAQYLENKNVSDYLKSQRTLDITVYRLHLRNDIHILKALSYSAYWVHRRYW